jgi:hypothetical protein
MQLSDAIVARLRERASDLYTEIGTMGASAPVSKTQLRDVGNVIDAPVSDDDKRAVLEVAKNRKVRSELREYARKTKTGSELSPDTKLVLARVTASYAKPWARKSAVIVETFLTTKLVEKAPRKRASKKAAAKS